MSSLKYTCLSLILVTTALPAQTTPTARSGSIGGQVVNANTGEPVRKATVQLIGVAGRGGANAAANRGGNAAASGENAGTSRGGRGTPVAPGRAGAPAQPGAQPAAGQVMGGPVGMSLSTFSTTTDLGGNFHIDGVPAGTYRVLAQRTGFVGMLGGRGGGGGRGRGAGGGGGLLDESAITLTDGQDKRGVVVKLTPAGVIAGRVTDEDGDAVESASVQVLRVTYSSGRRQLVPSTSVQTNDLGEYRLSGLNPGKYYLSVTKRGSIILRALAGAAGRGGGGGRGGPLGAGLQTSQEEYEYVTVYYPAAMEPQAATPIDVPAGMEMRGADFRLQKVRVFKVRGRVDGMVAAAGGGGRGGRGGGFAAPVTVMLQVNSRGQIGSAERRPGNVQQDGTFEFRGLRPGSYTAVAYQNSREMQLAARIPVEVGNSDLGGVTLHLEAMPTVTGRITAEGDQQPTLQRTNVQLVALDGGGPMGGGPMGGGGGRGGRTAQDGTFSIGPIEPNQYRIAVTGVPDGYYLKSVRWGTQEVLDFGLTVTSAMAGEVQVILAPGAASITGTASITSDQPASGVTVTLVPDSSRTNRWDLYRTTTSGDDGSFTFSGLPPGTYKLHAWEDIETGAHQDAMFMRPFDGAGQDVSVREKASETAKLKLIPASQTQGR